MTFKALIFDLDGTLIDSAPDLRTACNKVLASYERRPITLEETMKFVGNGAAKLIERAFRATGTPAPSEDLARLTQEFLSFYDGHEADETVTYPGVFETLATLQEQGYRLALCTNKPQKPTLNLLQDLKLDIFFEVVLGGDQLSARKPEPDMLFWVLDKMGLNVNNAVMVGDSPNDIEAARNAEMPNIAVSYGYRKVPVAELGADLVINQIKDLPEALDTLSSSL